MLYTMKSLVGVLRKSSSTIRIALYRYGVFGVREGKKIYYKIPHDKLNKIRYFLETRNKGRKKDF